MGETETFVCRRRLCFPPLEQEIPKVTLEATCILCGTKHTRKTPESPWIPEAADKPHRNAKKGTTQ